MTDLHPQLGSFFDRETTQMLQRWMQPTKSEDFKSSASTVFPPKNLHVAEIRPEWTSPRVRVVMCPALPWIYCYAEATFDCQRIGPHSCGDHQETGGGMTATWGMKVNSDHNPPMKKGKVEEIVVERLGMIEWQWMTTTCDRNISGCFAQMYIVWYFLYIEGQRVNTSTLLSGSFCFRRNTSSILLVQTTGEQWKTHLVV